MFAGGHPGLVISGSSGFRGRSTEIKLDHLRLASVEENLPRIAFIRVPSDTILVGLSVGAGVPPVWGGIRMQDRELVTLCAGQCVHVRTEGPCHWGAIWLPIQEFGRYASALTGAAMAVPPFVCCWRPPSGADRRLRKLYSAALRTTHRGSGPFTKAEAAHGLEQQLIHLLVECLSAAPANTAQPDVPRGQDVMARFEELIRNRPEGGLSTSDICAALDVPDRFLRKCCQHHLGMSPANYARLHRIQLANLALWNGPPQDVRIADVAARYGFHNPGGFAASYRGLYGELPSQTLRRSGEMPDLAQHNRAARAKARNMD